MDVKPVYQISISEMKQVLHFAKVTGQIAANAQLNVYVSMDNALLGADLRPLGNRDCVTSSQYYIVYLGNSRWI